MTNVFFEEYFFRGSLYVKKVKNNSFTREN
ncbi:Uncharacterised protein [Chryseobacterium indologenes]|nr:Uncharacterised protein [Chryseobacterium indologenes]